MQRRYKDIILRTSQLITTLGIKNMCTLTVDLKVPIESEPLISAPALTFTHWLPIGKAHGINVSDGDINLLLWFDLKATWWASQPKEEELKNHVNVLAHYVKAEITVSTISSELAFYMEGRDFTRLPSDTEKSIQNEYAKLGRRVAKILIERVNRLIGYARAYKGQYWLLEYEYSPDCIHGYFQKFESRGQINGGNWFRFQPGTGDTIHITMMPEDKYISESEWDDVCKFVKSSSRNPLIGELISRAEQLAGNGHRRSALTEAVAALECAVSKFGRSQKTNNKFSIICGKRLGIDRLQKQIEHMGLSGTVGYLFPVIFPDKILSTDILAGCREALAQRQNVIHNGQRDVNEDVLFRSISNIKKFCKILDQYSQD